MNKNGKTRIPGFTAEASLYETNRFYHMEEITGALSDASGVSPQIWWIHLLVALMDAIGFEGKAY